MERGTVRPPAPWLLAGIGLIGAAVSLAIGLYANEHTPTGESILGDGLFFSATLTMKAWLATAFVALALFQLFTALRMFERIPVPRRMPSWLPTAHRLSGALAVLISLAVAIWLTSGLWFFDTFGFPSF